MQEKERKKQRKRRQKGLAAVLTRRSGEKAFPHKSHLSDGRRSEDGMCLTRCMTSRRQAQEERESGHEHEYEDARGLKECSQRNDG